MTTKLAALGIGIAVAVAPSVALAADCAPAHGSSTYPTSTYPTFPSSTYPGSYPVSTYPTYPSHGAPVPVYSPGWSRTPPPPARRTVLLSRADYNRDGGITFAEAQAYGRAEFGHADVDRNGVLTRRELDNHFDEFARGARRRARRDGVITFAEYDTSVRDRFIELDRNRDSLVSRYELEGRPEPKTVGFRWHWQL